MNMMQESSKARMIEIASKPPSIDELKKVARDTTPHLNIAKSLPEEEYSLPEDKDINDIMETASTDYGMFSKMNVNISAIMAFNQVHSNLSLPQQSDTTGLSAPKLGLTQCPMVAESRYYTKGDRKGAFFGVFDYNQGKWLVVKNFDNTEFQNNYIRSVQGLPNGSYYHAMVSKQSGPFQVNLFNFNTAKWEEQASVNNTRDYKYTYSIFQTENFGSCPSIPSITSGDIDLLIDGSWKKATPDISQIIDRLSCNYSRNVPVRNSQWSVGP